MLKLHKEKPRCLISSFGSGVLGTKLFIKYSIDDLEIGKGLNDTILTRLNMKINKIVNKFPPVSSFTNGLEKPTQINETVQETASEQPVEQIFYSVGGQSYKEIVEEFENWINQSY